MALGTRLQELRKGKSISQEKFAEVMDVSRQAVSKWELDQSYPEIDKLIEISDYFNVTLDYLMKNGNDEGSRVSIISKEENLADNKDSSFVDVYKIIVLSGIALALTSIRFMIMGDFKAGIVLASVSCVFVIGFYIARSYRINN